MICSVGTFYDPLVSTTIPPSEWLVCDRDFWQFIKIILCVYILIDGSEIFNNIAPGTSFASRHHRGHPETWSGLERWDYTALMEVAHRTDLPADDTMERCAVVNTPGLLGRRRWRLFDGDVEIVGPIRRSILAVRAVESSAQYMLQSRRGEIAHMHTGCWWVPLRAPSGLGQRLQLSKFLFDWWAVKLNQVKKGQTEDTEGADECTCGHPETQLHLLLECTAPQMVVIRRLFEKKPVKLISKFNFSSKSKRTLKQCFGLTPAGTCPDWTGHSFVWPEGDLASALRASIDDPIGLFRKGLLPVEFLENDGEEIEYGDLLKFGKSWFRLKRDEAMMIWRARNGMVHRDEEPFCWATLRSKFRDALLFLREQGKSIPNKEARRTASRHFMEKFVAKTSKNASAELIVSFLVDELQTPLNTAERLLLVQRSQKSAIGARISRARLVRGARQREASKVQSSLTKH